MLRLHLNVAGEDFHQHLKQVHLRPAILILLLQELFRSKHEAFVGSLAGESMNMELDAPDDGDSVSARFAKSLADAVHQHYPEQEAPLLLNARRGSIPEGIREEIEEQKHKQDGLPQKKQHTLHSTKNATPGDAAQELSSSLDDVRPKAFTLDLKPSDCTTPDLQRSGTLQRYGELHIQTGNKLQSQWESKYFSKALPFCFPRMVSGPDFKVDDKWRRGNMSAVVTPLEFNRGIARRVEGQIRNDAVCLPIIRSVCYKRAVEHAGDMLAP